MANPDLSRLERMARLVCEAAGARYVDVTELEGARRAPLYRVQMAYPPTASGIEYTQVYFSAPDLVRDDDEMLSLVLFNPLMLSVRARSWNAVREALEQ